jgi:type I restriction enzyme M protein
MQDDVYVISDNGWQAGREVYRIIKTTRDKNGNNKEKLVEGIEGIESKLLKPELIVSRYFLAEKQALSTLEAKREAITAELEQMEEEYGVEEGLLAEARNDKDKITAASVKDRMKRIKGSEEDEEEYLLLQQYLKLSDTRIEIGKKIASGQKELEAKVWDQYKALTDKEIITLVVDDKWIPVLDHAIRTEMQRISLRLAQRIKELADRYETPLPLLLQEVKSLEEEVNAHLTKMGFVWS